MIKGDKDGYDNGGRENNNGKKIKVAGRNGNCEGGENDKDNMKKMMVVKIMVTVERGSNFSVQQYS